MSKPFKLTKKEVKTQLDLDGEIIDVVIQPLKIASQFMDIYTHLCEVQLQLSHFNLKLQKMQAEQGSADLEFTPELLNEKNTVLEAYGKAILDLMIVTFGEDLTVKLTEFYSDDYTVMLAELLPFIATEVLPTIKTHTDNLKRMSRKAYLKGGGKIGHLDAGQ